VTATVTDPAGNSDTDSDNGVIDAEVPTVSVALEDASGGIYSAEEIEDGINATVTLGAGTQVGDTLVVVDGKDNELFNGPVTQAMLDDGLVVTITDLENSDTAVSVTATVTDPAGNSDTDSDNGVIDTSTPIADPVLSTAEIFTDSDETPEGVETIPLLFRTFTVGGGVDEDEKGETIPTVHEDDPSLGGKDNETTEENLVFTLHSLPSYGTLYINVNGSGYEVADVGTEFTSESTLYWAADATSAGGAGESYTLNFRNGDGSGDNATVYAYNFDGSEGELTFQSGGMGVLGDKTVQKEVPTQLAHRGDNSEMIVVDFNGPATNATISVSNLIAGDEKEVGKVEAFLNGVSVGKWSFSKVADGGDLLVSGSGGVGTFSLPEGIVFDQLRFTATDLVEGGSGMSDSDSSDYFLSEITYTELNPASFQYTVTDEVGNVSEPVKVVINPDSSTPVPEYAEPTEPPEILGLDGTNATVYEAFLENGTGKVDDDAPDDADKSAQGGFTIKASAGVASLTFAGDGFSESFTIDQLNAVSESAPLSVTTTKGVLSITGFTDNEDGTYAVDYSYTLTTAIDHPDEGRDPLPKDAISVTVTDSFSRTADDSLNVTIVDDAPTFENIMNAIIANESGTAVTGFHDLSFGADGLGAIFVTDPVNDAFNGEVSYTTTVNGDGSVTKLAKVDGEDFFTLTVKADGTYDFTLHEARLSILQPVDFSGVSGGKSVDQLVIGDVTISAVDTDGNGVIGNKEQIKPTSAGFGVGEGNVDAGEQFNISFADDTAVDSVGLFIKHQGSTDFVMSWASDTGETGTTSAISQDGWVTINPTQNFTSITFTINQGSGKIEGVEYAELLLPDDAVFEFKIHGTDDDGDSSSSQTLSVTLLGAASSDTQIVGTSGDDVIAGTSGNDELIGGAGDDILIGGAGNDILTGGLGDDVFKWNFGDQGVSDDNDADSAAVDIVTDFGKGHNVLDLADLLEGENVENINSFIVAEEEGDNTTLYIKHDGGLDAGGANADQKIVLENYDMGGMTSEEFIQQLLSNNQLNIDH
ncbi:type I secretion C-terminal target domain-containing protein, partial [Halomonas sp. M5N1S17]|uniref:type I secretion C-terminal target domain-containing protein n=1 Tax=Halomonas alkalisoli TaxID=2907158 RepID=UPI001F43BBAA